MNEKKADNFVLSNNRDDSTKKQIEKIDNSIYEQKKEMSNIDSTKDKMNEINKSINNCLDILSKSMHSKESRRMLENLRTESEINLKRSTSILNENKESIQKNINKLNSAKNNVSNKKDDEKDEKEE